MISMPSIPDNINKILIAFGVAIILFANYYLDNYSSKYDTIIAKIDSAQINLYERSDRVEYLLKKIKGKAEIIASRTSKKNPLEGNDSVLYFNRILKGSRDEEIINDSIWNIYEEFRDENFELTQLKKRVIDNENLKNFYNEILESKNQVFNYQVAIGFILIIQGLIYLALTERMSIRIMELEIKAKEKIECCQSCAKTFKLLTLKGTNSEGKEIEGFCFDCYQNGEFTDSELSFDKVFAKIIKEKNIKFFIWKWVLKRYLRKLDRWSGSKYF